MTSKNIDVIGTSSIGLWYNCPNHYINLVFLKKLTKQTKIKVGNNVFKGFLSVHQVTAI